MTQKKSINRIAVIGGGSWATALVKILSENNLQLNWWLKNEEDVEHIIKYRHNPSYLSNIEINTSLVTPSIDIIKTLKDVEAVILVVPAAFIKEVLDKVPQEYLQNKLIVSAIKGMIPQIHFLVTDYLEREFAIEKKKLCVIGGPCHSEEVAMEKQSYLTVGGLDKTSSEEIAALLRCRFVKASVITDPDGIEYCAVMKNIIAIASGIARGLNYGDNFQAVLVSNAMHEIEHFLAKVSPMKERDLHASAYLGDLLVTCYSQFSRNRTLGNMVGRGYSVKAAQVEMNMIAEGYYAVYSINELNKKLGIDMPVTKAVYNILYEKISPSVELKILENTMK